MDELFGEKALVRREGSSFVGIFLPNEHANQFITSASGLTDSTYEEIREVAQIADEIGVAFALTVARWKGVPGDNVGYAMYGFDTFTLAAALFEATKKLSVISTAHTIVWHPVVAAKLGADLDQISGGRWGLNIVAGWSESEFRSMGISLLDHERRYEQASEWLRAVRELWVCGRSSRKNDFFQLTEAECRPRPVQAGGPLLVNAGSSPTGMKFAVENCDFLFSTSANPVTLAQLRKEHGSSVGYIAMKRVLLAKTEAEAEAKAAEILAGADVLAIARRQAGALTAGGEGLSAEQLRQSVDPEVLRRALIGDAIVGTPTKAARELAAWIAASEVDGLCLALYDFQESLSLLAAEGFEVLGNELAARGRELVLR
jgi:alkanesulfonate monooxygenase SsuD/methylene tetrahydromethanopterin reductase-like flavin-dependent oxidoreductase (luciferase family)